MLSLYRAFEAVDGAMVEVNPFLMTKAGDLFALDAKVSFDDKRALPPPRAEGAARLRRGKTRWRSMPPSTA